VSQAVASSTFFQGLSSTMAGIKVSGMTIRSGSTGTEGTAGIAASVIPAALIPTFALETLALGGLLLLSRP